MCSVGIVLDEELRRWGPRGCRKQRRKREGERMERTERNKKGVMERKGLMDEG